MLTRTLNTSRAAASQAQETKGGRNTPFCTLTEIKETKPHPKMLLTRGFACRKHNVNLHEVNWKPVKAALLQPGDLGLINGQNL